MVYPLLREYTERCKVVPMMLKPYLLTLSVEQREDLAKRCDTSSAHLRNVAYGSKTCGEDLAMKLDRETQGAVTCEELRPDLAEQFAYLRSTGAAKAAA